MQFISQWMGEASRKRPAEDGSQDQEESRKRPRDDNERHESIGIGIGSPSTSASASASVMDMDQEYKIRGSSTAVKDAKGYLHSSSPFPKPPRAATLPLPSLSPPIHPDRLGNFYNASPPSAPAPAPTPCQNEMDYLLSPPSQAFMHANIAETDEQRAEALHSTPHPNLRIDTGCTLSNLGPPTPDYPAVTTSHLSEKSHHSPSHDPRKPSLDSHHQIKSRRQSDVMPPPPNATRIVRSETSTPNAISPLTKSEVGRRKLSTVQAQVPLLDSLNYFAQSIMSAASLTVRRDLVKQHAVGQQKERDRQSRFNPTFLTLIEDAESRSEGVEKISTAIEKQMELSSEAQSNFAVGLASQLQETGISDTSSSIRDQGRLESSLAALKAASKKAELKAAKRETDDKRDRGRFKDDLADFKADLKAARKDISYLNREAITADEFHKKLRSLPDKDELRALATKDELQGLISKDELRRVTSDEVHKRVTEALVPTEKRLASFIVENANLDKKLRSFEAVSEKQYDTVEEKDRQGIARLHRLDTSLQETQVELSRLELIVQERKLDNATIKIDLEAQDKALTNLDAYVRRDSGNEDPSLDKMVKRHSEQIQLLQHCYKKPCETVVQTQDIPAIPNTGSSPQVSNASSAADTRIEEEFKSIHSKFDALTSEQQDFHLIRQDLDTLKLDGEKFVLMRNDLDSLINEEKLKDAGVAEGFESIEESLNKQHEDMARLKNEVRLVRQSQASHPVLNHPPTPPFAGASTSPRESDHQKLQDVELRLRKLTKTVQILELFVNSQQQKFDGLTSDRIVQHMVHQMQQMYPHHPGNLVGLVNQTAARLQLVDSYLGNLQGRFANIESQVAARVSADSRIEEISHFTVESRRILKQDIEGLRLVTLKDRLREPSDYGTRLNDLVDRVTNVENRYVKAIENFQTNQTDLVRDVTHLQYRTGTASTRNTPGELTGMSRNSKSVEPNGSAISHQNVNDSDCSDTPLSLRSDRGTRQEREEHGPTDAHLKRKAGHSDEEAPDEGGEARSTSVKKIPKRRNVSGINPFS